MASAKDVFAAIATTWSNAASLSSYNGPYRDMKAYNAAMTHVVFTSTANSRAARTCSREYWQHTFRFTIRAATHTAVESALEAIGAVFDAATLNISNGGQVSLERVTEGYFSEDEKVAVAVLEYRLVRSKTRLDV